MIPIVIEQSLDVRGQFDGTMPSAAPTDQDGVRIYPAETGIAGGRFRAGAKFEVAGGTVREMELGTSLYFRTVQRVILDMTGLPVGGTWELRIKSVGGMDVLWLNGGVVEYILSDPDHIRLAPDEWLELTTSIAATGPCLARITFERILAYP
jgi:hypothetical protein